MATTDEYPDDLRYTREHEWARVAGAVATVGITRFAVEQLGDVTQVDLPKPGAEVAKDQVFGTVESVKAVSDLFAPCSGRVRRANDALVDHPERVNQAPYQAGWMIEVELSDPAELDGLMTAAQYREFLRSQG